MVSTLCVPLAPMVDVARERRVDSCDKIGLLGVEKRDGRRRGRNQNWKPHHMTGRVARPHRVNFA